jgi:16S rRNA (cytosine967-C5)-methyltransferase
LAAAARRGSSVEDLLAQALKRHPGLPRVERALLLELVQGVKRWEIQLDYFLSQAATRPLPKLHPLVLQSLRLGAFQILKLNKVPARAAVNEAARLARARGLPEAHVGFINAVLRRLSAGDLPPLPPPETEPALALSVEHSHPLWLVKRWLGRYGPEATQARLTANNQIPPLTIRVNTLKTDPQALITRLSLEGAEAAPCRFSPVGLHLKALGASPTELPSYREGLWLFQDEAAQLVTFLLGVRPGEQILELGSGRGGKTSHLAEILGGWGFILALDNHRRRLQEAATLLRRWGVNLAQPLLADATRALPLKPGALDGVLMDAPCSALGIIRRHPEIKTRLQEGDLATFPPRQRAMLDQAAALLKAGGRILYITCTTEPEENEDLIMDFLSRHRDFRLATDPQLLPPAARSLVQPPGFFRTSPAEHHLDGFFAAVLAKEG